MFTLIIFEKNLFPYKVPFTDSGSYQIDNVGGYHYCRSNNTAEEENWFSWKCHEFS